MMESKQGTLILLIIVLFSLFLPIFGWTVAIPPEKKTFESTSAVILTSILFYSCEILLIMWILKKHGYKASDLGSIIKIIDRIPKVRFYEMSEKDRAFLNNLSFLIAVFPVIVFIFGLHIFEYADI